jgi:hypothetical protein
MSEKVDKPYQKDEFFKKWLVGLSERTKKNYTNEIQGWLVFVGMTPTEQIKKRMHDLSARAHLWRSNKGDLQMLKEVMRHSDIRITMIYSTPSTGEINSEFEKTINVNLPPSQS